MANRMKIKPRDFEKMRNSAKTFRDWDMEVQRDRVSAFDKSDEIITGKSNNQIFEENMAILRKVLR